MLVVKKNLCSEGWHVDVTRLSERNTDYRLSNYLDYEWFFHEASHSITPARELCFGVAQQFNKKAESKANAVNYVQI